MKDELFDVTGKVVVVTGAGGVLMGELAVGLARRGGRVVAVGRTRSKLGATVARVMAAGGEAMAVEADVCERAALERARDEVGARLGRVDVLINGAGGNLREATAGADRAFFDLPAEALRAVMDVNVMGSVLPSQVFGGMMAERGEGVIVNVSSMASFQPLTRVVGYSAAKAALNNFTQWLAVHLATTCSPRIRVNAVAPGFFLTEQNRFLLSRAEDGGWTERGRQILDHTPMGRLGEPDDLVGTVVWLVSGASGFVTGVVVPVDGGFSAFSGV
mgnify:CR=1 FL=1